MRMPLLLADFIHIKVCKPNLRKTLDTTSSPVSIGFLPFGIYRIYAEKLALKMRKNLDFIEVFCLGIFFSALLWSE